MQSVRIAASLFAFCAMTNVASAPPQERDSTTAFPPGPLGETIRLGRDIVAETVTHPLAKDYVRNSLNCTSCHLDNGTHLHAATFIGVATAYPAWSPREQRVITLEDRALNCFMRSCNGTRPPLGSKVSVAVTAYITWLSTNQAVSMNGSKPLGPNSITQLEFKGMQSNAHEGKSLYSQRCASCHGADGQGDEENPPVWGDKSYNDGAGLANVKQLASWLKVAMPLGESDLTDIQALDIAEYMNQHPRPHFQLSEHLPPNDHMGEYNGNQE